MLENLPINAQLPRILESIENNPATIIIGPTACGKTLGTLENLFWLGMKSAATQPRRLAAKSICETLANILESIVGDKVGYHYRFEKRFNEEVTVVKLVTDGTAFEEILIYPLFDKYFVVVFDEAHERITNTDILIALARRILEVREDIHVVVMSATIDERKFSKFLFNAPIIRVEGRTFPIEKNFITEKEEKAARELVPQKGISLVEALAVYKIRELFLSEPNKKIMCFLPGKQQIYQVKRILEAMDYPDMFVVPLHADMTPEQQDKIFAKVNGTLVILSTTIGQTGITIDGLTDVVASGVTKRRIFKPALRVYQYIEVEASKADLEQQIGRTGRTRKGNATFLFREEEYETGRSFYLLPEQKGRDEYPRPHILEENLSGPILKLLSLNINMKILPMLDPPHPKQIDAGFKSLAEIQAVKGENLTKIGKYLAKLGIEPQIGKMVLSGPKHHCAQEMCTLGGILSTRQIFTTLPEEHDEAEKIIALRSQLVDFRSDFLTKLHILEEYVKSNKNHTWANQRGLNWNILDEIVNVQEQLKQILLSLGYTINSSGYQFPSGSELTAEQNWQEQVIGTALITGLSENVCIRHPYKKYVYYHATAGTVYPHRSSALRKVKQTPFIMLASEVIITDQATARVCMRVEPQWIVDAIPHLIDEKTIYKGDTQYTRSFFKGAFLTEEKKESTWNYVNA